MGIGVTCFQAIDSLEFPFLGVAFGNHRWDITACAAVAKNRRHLCRFSHFCLAIRFICRWWFGRMWNCLSVVRVGLCRLESLGFGFKLRI